MTMLDDLLREAGDELDRLSIEWGEANRSDRRQPRRRRERRGAALAAAGLAAAAVTGLVAVDRLRPDGPGANLAGTSTVAAPTTAPPLAPADLPYEVLASVPAGFDLETGYHGGFGKDFEPPVVLLGWQGVDPDVPMAYVSLERTSPAWNEPASADQIADDNVTGWVGRFGDLTNAQFDVAGQPLNVHAFTRAIPVADLTALAAATTGDGLEIDFKGGVPPAPFVELARQHVDAFGNIATYVGPHGASIGYAVATDIPLNYYPSDSPIAVSRVSVAGLPGVALDYTVEGQMSRQLFWRGPDGVWRMLSSSSPEGPLPVPQMLTLAAARRPATPDETALFDDMIAGEAVESSEPVAPDALPFEVLDPPDGYAFDQSAQSDVIGLDPPALLLGWEKNDQIIPIQVARADLLSALFPDGRVNPREIDSDDAFGIISDDGRGIVAEIEVDGVPVYFAAASNVVSDETLVAIAVSIDPNAEQIEWIDGAPPPGVVELARQETPAVVHGTTYRSGNRSITVQTLSAMPVMWMSPSPHTLVRTVDVHGQRGFEFVEVGVGATTRWLFWTGDDGVVRSIVGDSPNDDIDLVALVDSIRPATREEIARFTG